MVLRFIALLLVAGACTGCGIPDDPHETLERVRGDTMWVGVVENEPWVRRVDGTPAGIEPDLVRRFAETLDAEIAWKWGGLEEHMEALKRYNLDLVIGGLGKATPWGREVGLTGAYYTTHIVVGAPRGVDLPAELDGVPIAVEPGTPVAGYVREADAEAVPVEDLSRVEGYVAAPDWQLAAWGFNPAGAVLHRVQHVMAVPPGENDWLVHLENVLDGQRLEIERRLREEAQR